MIAGLCCSSAPLTLVVTNYKQVHEINIFAVVLVVQSLPFLSAVGIALIEGTRFNSFAYWRGVEAQARGRCRRGPRPSPSRRSCRPKIASSRAVAGRTLSVRGSDITRAARSPRAAPSTRSRAGSLRR